MEGIVVLLQKETVMPTETVVGTIAITAIVLLAFHEVWAAHRRRVPHRRALIDMDLEIREYACGVTMYYLRGERVPEYQEPFIWFDIWCLRRKEKGNLQEISRHVGKYGRTVSQEEVELYQRRVISLACRETQGRIRRARCYLKGEAPYVYHSRIFVLKGSAVCTDFKNVSSA
jgi:hypothetical protein